MDRAQIIEDLKEWLKSWQGFIYPEVVLKKIDELEDEYE